MADSDANAVRDALAASLQDLTRADTATALARLQALTGPLANDPMVHLHVALAHKQTGDADAEMAALLRALAVDPGFYPALLQAATWHERRGRQREAARLYGSALQALPAADRRNPKLQPALAHAAAMVRAEAERLAAHVDRACAEARAQHRDADLARLDETIDVFVGRKRAYPSQPSGLLCTRLPALPFYPRELLPWLGEFEAASAPLAEEAANLVAEHRAEFTPCVALPAGSPAGAWHELDRSPRWARLDLWRGGERLESNLARCPVTAAQVQRVPLPTVRGVAPNVAVTCLEARTGVPPHGGETNSRITVVLPLLVAGPATLRVGNDTRPLLAGQALAFDESIEHEWRNDADGTLVTLTCDVWNPLLSPAECALLATAIAAAVEYHRQPT